MAGGGGSSCLHHSDALPTKIDMWLTPYTNKERVIALYMKKKKTKQKKDEFNQ